MEAKGDGVKTSLPSLSPVHHGVALQLIRVHLELPQLNFFSKKVAICTFFFSDKTDKFGILASVKYLTKSTSD